MDLVNRPEPSVDEKIACPTYWGTVVGLTLQELKKDKFQESLDLLRDHLIPDELMCKALRLADDSVSTESLLLNALECMRDGHSIVALGTIEDEEVEEEGETQEEGSVEDTMVVSTEELDEDQMKVQEHTDDDERRSAEDQDYDEEQGNDEEQGDAEEQRDEDEQGSGVEQGDGEEHGGGEDDANLEKPQEDEAKVERKVSGRNLEKPQEDEANVEKKGAGTNLEKPQEDETKVEKKDLVQKEEKSVRKVKDKDDETEEAPVEPQVVAVMVGRVVQSREHMRSFSRMKIVPTQSYQKYRDLRCYLQKKADLFEKYDVDTYYRIYHIVVHPQFRRKGVASFLLHLARLRLTALFGQRILTAVAPSRATQELLAKCCFRPVVTQFYHDWKDGDEQIFSDLGVGNYSVALCVCELPVREGDEPIDVTPLEDNKDEDPEPEPITNFPVGDPCMAPGKPTDCQPVTLLLSQTPSRQLWRE